MFGKRLQFVVGKGGVGKSTVAASLALAAADGGRRVLLVELGSPGGVARLFDSPPLRSNEPLEMSPGLFLAYVEGDSALAEYLQLVVPIKRLLRLVFDSNAYHSFVAAAPGLKELMTMGKIWYEAERKDDKGDPFWEHIVVDAGASGHSLQYLQMPATAAKTFKSGLVHRESLRVFALLEDADSTAVHVVASPEDMPLVEACEIIERLRGDLRLPLGRLFVNRCRQSPPAGADAAVATMEDLEVDPADAEIRDGILQAARSALGWHHVQERGIALAETRLQLAATRLPLLLTEEFRLSDARKLAALLKALPEETPG